MPQDLAERIGELAARVGRGGELPPGDEAVRAHQDGSVGGDLPVPQPGAARVEEIAVEVADPDSVERDAGLVRKLACRLAPCATVLAGNEQEAPGATRSLIGRRRPSSSSTQACGSGAPGRVPGRYTRMSSREAGSSVPSGTIAAEE